MIGPSTVGAMDGVEDMLGAEDVVGSILGPEDKLGGLVGFMDGIEEVAGPTEGTWEGWDEWLGILLGTKDGTADALC